VADEASLKARARWSDSLRRYFLAGLLVFLPLAITLWFIGWVIDLLDSVLPSCRRASPQLLSALCDSETRRGRNTAADSFLGMLTARGDRRFLAAWESIFIQIPVFRGIYSAVPKVGSQPFSDNRYAQRSGSDDRSTRARLFHGRLAMGRACLILRKKRMPSSSTFCADDPKSDSGFYLLVPSNEVPRSYDDGRALKLITSSGLITPGTTRTNMTDKNPPHPASKLFCATARHGIITLSTKPTKPAWSSVGSEVNVAARRQGKSGRQLRAHSKRRSLPGQTPTSVLMRAPTSSITSRRDAQLLLHEREIERLTGKTKERGLTLIRSRFISKTAAPGELGWRAAKNFYDKRETLRRKVAQREVERRSRVGTSGGRSGSKV